MVRIVILSGPSVRETEFSEYPARDLQAPWLRTCLLSDGLSQGRDAAEDAPPAAVGGGAAGAPTRRVVVEPPARRRPPRRRLTPSKSPTPTLRANRRGCCRGLYGESCE